MNWGQVKINQISRKEKVILRIMICFGIIGWGLLLILFLQTEYRENTILYGLFIAAIFTLLITILLEWYHYYSISVPQKVDVSDITYSVDIFTTFCEGEPYEMIEETLRAIVAVEYPHISYLCDEADDPYLKKLCAQLGVVHVTRKVKINAKAGNINNALQQTQGELCVILDPDHVPSSDLLDDIVPLFQDEKIGFVQIVQAYSNNEDSYIAKGAAQQTYQFYGPMMLCMNTYGTVQAIGANCCFRRKALDSIGGHAAGLAEDMHTSMRLHAQGWRSVYVPKILTRGLVPNTLSAYYKQQLKWSKGTFDLLFHVYPRVFSQLSRRQKLHYATIAFHYLSGIMYLLNFLIPIVSLISGVYPVSTTVSQMIMLGIPVIIIVNIIRLYVQRWVMEETERGMHVVGGLLQIGTWWIFILGLIYAIVGKKLPYIPTPKKADDTSFGLLLPNIIIILASILAIIYGLNYNLTPYTIGMTLFACLNVIVLSFNVLIALQDVTKDDSELTYEQILLQDGWVKKSKRYIWKLRHRIYSVSRSYALLIVLVCSMSCYWLYIQKQMTSDNYSIEYNPVVQNTTVASSYFHKYTSDTIINNVIYENPYNGMLAVDYDKCVDWLGNIHTLNYKIVSSDFNRMVADLNVNTIRRVGPGIYDRIILQQAADKSLNVCYTFKIPESVNWANDVVQKTELKDKILLTVQKYNNTSIKYWHIEPDIFNIISSIQDSLKLIQQLREYSVWLNNLSKDIESISSKPLSLSLKADKLLKEKVQYIENEFQAFDGIGISTSNSDSVLRVHRNLHHIPYFIISDSRHWDSTLHKFPVVIGEWQDQQSANGLYLKGLFDHKGRPKREYMLWKGQTVDNIKVSIMKPALLTFPEAYLSYSAFLIDNNKLLMNSSTENYKYEWYLIQKNRSGFYHRMQLVGEGQSIKIKVPDQPMNYDLYIIVESNQGVIYEKTTSLNIPLKYGSGVVR